MKKFILKLTKRFLLIYLILLTIQSIIDFYLAQDNSCNNNTWSKIYDGKLDTDIAIFGTSRAEFQYNPEIIRENTGLKTYNFGLSGTEYTALKIRWEAYIHRNKTPKIVILDLDVNSLKKTHELFNKYQYLPYFNSKEYQKFAKINDSNYYLEKLIPLYKYRGYEIKIYKQLLALHNTSYCLDGVNGYIEHDIKWIKRDYQRLKTLLEKDKKRINYDYSIFNEGLTQINSIIEDCNQKNIKLFFVWSPSYYESQLYELEYRSYIKTSLEKISNNNNIPFIDYSNDSICLNRDNFYNSSHLNKKGATLFTLKLTKDFKPFINQLP